MEDTLTWIGLILLFFSGLYFHKRYKEADAKYWLDHSRRKNVHDRRTRKGTGRRIKVYCGECESYSDLQDVKDNKCPCCLEEL